MRTQFEPFAEELWEAQVVADRGADGQVVPGVGEDVGAALEEFGLAAEGERVDLAVFAEEAFVRRDDRGGVERLVAVAGADGPAALDRDAQVVGEAQQEAERAVFGVGVLFCAEAEARVEEFGEDDEVARIGRSIVEGDFDESIVGFVVFPHEVELQEMGSHRGHDSRGLVRAARRYDRIGETRVISE